MEERWLLGTHHLFGWGGSELVTIELAEELMSRGIRVDLYSPFPHREFIKSFMGDITVISRPDQVNLFDYDVVYSQHQVMSRVIAASQQALTANPSDALPFFIYNHLSPFEPFEFPGPFVEADIADIILCNSMETQEKIKAYGPAFKAATLYQNPSPWRYDVMAARGIRPYLKKIMLVSNHLPHELQSVADILQREHAVEICHLGLGGEHRRIVPADFLDFDAVVTIGKTVQYAIRAGCPVYCYDRFGGPGWLLQDNFEVAAAHNFSGRCVSRHIPVETIVEEIISGYGEAQHQAGGFTHIKFCLEAGVDDMRRRLKRLGKKPSAFTRLVNSENYAKKAAKWAHEAELYKLVDQQFAGFYPILTEIMPDSL